MLSVGCSLLFVVCCRVLFLFVFRFLNCQLLIVIVRFVVFVVC